MADDSLEAQLRRLAAIVAPLAETVNQHDARMAVLEAIVIRLDATLAQQAERLTQHDAIVARLDRLIAEVFRERQNGQEA
jgi:ABC-type transporter Mla subunit MlaD